jgi:hypothetical protein
MVAESLLVGPPGRVIVPKKANGGTFRSERYSANKRVLS